MMKYDIYECDEIKSSKNDKITEKQRKKYSFWNLVKQILI